MNDVDVLRKTLKTVYSSSSSLRGLNSDHENEPENCRVQVLPVCWRHLIDFPERKKSKDRENKADDSDCKTCFDTW